MSGAWGPGPPPPPGRLMGQSKNGNSEDPHAVQAHCEPWSATKSDGPNPALVHTPDSSGSESNPVASWKSTETPWRKASGQLLTIHSSTPLLQLSPLGRLVST